jgi:hypothetical protein
MWETVILITLKISNICDLEYVGPQKCLNIFPPLLKPKQQSPGATLLMLFMNAASGIDRQLNPTGNVAELDHGRARMQVHRPIPAATIVLMTVSAQGMYHPDLIMLLQTVDMFKDWDKYFDLFVESMKIVQSVETSGLKIKKEHTIVQPWPHRIRPTSTTREFDILCASGSNGNERYMELESAM